MFLVLMFGTNLFFRHKSDIYRAFIFVRLDAGISALHTTIKTFLIEYAKLKDLLTPANIPTLITLAQLKRLLSDLAMLVEIFFLVHWLILRGPVLSPPPFYG